MNLVKIPTTFGMHLSYSKRNAFYMQRVAHVSEIAKKSTCVSDERILRLLPVDPFISATLILYIYRIFVNRRIWRTAWYSIFDKKITSILIKINLKVSAVFKALTWIEVNSHNRNLGIYCLSYIIYHIWFFWHGIQSDRFLCNFHAQYMSAHFLKFCVKRKDWKESFNTIKSYQDWIVSNT